jgi:hypothetical protein
METGERALYTYVYGYGLSCEQTDSLMETAEKCGGPQEDRTPDLCVANADLPRRIAECSRALSLPAGTAREWRDGLPLILPVGFGVDPEEHVRLFPVALSLHGRD